MEQIAIGCIVIFIAIVIYVIFLLLLDVILRSNCVRAHIRALVIDPYLRLSNEDDDDEQHVIVIVPTTAAAKSCIDSSSPLAAAIPTFPFKVTMEGSLQKCPICLGDLESMEMVGALPRCTHLFHEDCIKLWLHRHSDCPVCRATVEPI